MNHDHEKTRVMREIPIESDRLIRLIEKVGYGELRVVIVNGKPVRVENVVKQVKLDAPEDFDAGLRTVAL